MLQNLSGAPTMGKLEEFCIKNALVLMGTVQAWRDEMPDSPFEAMLVRNFMAINEGKWMDAVAGLPTTPTPMPIMANATLPPSAISPAGEELRRKHFAIVLLDSPLLVIGILNHVHYVDVVNAAAELFPGQELAVVSISPHGFAALAGLAERGVANFDGNWDEDLAPWCRLLGFNEDTFPDLSSVVADLWSTEPSTLVYPPRQIGDVLDVEGENAVFLFRSATHAWIGTPAVTDMELQDRIQQKTGLRLIMCAVGPKELARIRASRHQDVSAVEVVEETPLYVRSWKLAENATGDDALERISLAAIEMGASDIHMDPKEDRVRIRFRINNDLVQQPALPKQLYLEIVRRIKTLGGMMQEKTGLFQDGAGWRRFKGIRYDFRYAVSIVNGGEEAVVIRIFNARIPDLSDLRLFGREMEALMWFLKQDSGLMVTTGPTGSGKTTTLYACLKELSDPSVSIVTVEQPVEKFFEEAKQIPVKEEGNATFATALRSILRQDPDIIMVGEIRDEESAKIAIQAALTGHLVLTTTHANDATGVVERLCGSFGIDRVSLGYALKLSIAQRLVEKLCPYCRRQRPATARELEHFPHIEVPDPIISERSSCPACRHTGISGRMVVMEMMPVDGGIASLIGSRATPAEITAHNRKRGYMGLLEQATYLLQNGEIAVEEAMRFLTKPI